MAKPRLPMDRGWAWLVMIGTFVNTMVVLSFVRALAILLPVFLDRYRQSVTVTTLAFGIAEIMESVANLVIPAIFLPRFEVRTLCVCGALANAGSILALAFTGNIVLLNVLFGCIGFSRGFMLNPQTFILGCYFKRRLSFASACSNLGIGAATLLAPQAARLLLQAYNLQWTFLMIGAYSLHAVVASLLFRPTSKYRNKEEASSTSASTDAATDEETESGISSTMKSNTRRMDTAEADAFIITAKSTDCNAETGFTQVQLMGGPDGDNGGTSNIKIPRTENKDHHQRKVPSQRNKVSFRGKPRTEIDSTTTDVFEKDDGYHELTPLGTEVGSASRNGDGNKDIPGFKGRIRQALSQSICAQPVALLLIVATGVGVNTQAGNVYFPVLGLENGLTDDQLPWLLTITGATDIFGKLIIGLLADTNCMSPLYIVCLTQAIAGISLQMAPLYKGMAAMSVACAVYGTTAGIMHILLPTLVVQLLDLASLPRVISGYFLLNCVVTFLMHMVVGSIKDATGSFAGGFQFVGSLLLFSVLVLLLVVPVSQRGNAADSGPRRMRGQKAMEVEETLMVVGDSATESGYLQTPCSRNNCTKVV